MDRVFHYSVPPGLDVPPAGAVVRVRLHGRRVRGWVVDTDSTPPPGVELQPLLDVVSVGPPPAVVDLCRWVAWRWAGRLRAPLVAASPERVVKALPPPRSNGYRHPGASGDAPVAGESLLAAVRAAIDARDAVLRLPPIEERLPVVEAAISEMNGTEGGVLVMVESRDDVARLSTRLRRNGWQVASYPEEWAASASARVVVGTRNAAFAPSRPALTVVLDAHSDSYRSERVPTFDARAVVAERARRLGGRVVFVTACPSVELLSGPERSLVVLPRSIERVGWGTVAVLDRRAEDPADGGYPSRLVSWIREAAELGESRRKPVVCILNRVGRARLLTCGLCRAVQRCHRCGGAQVQLARPPRGEIGMLTCPRCDDEQPAICQACGSARLRVARSGVSRAREQLEAVSGLQVGEVSGPRSPVPETPVIMGTQAALHRVRAASMVVWLDFDQELMAPRFRAAEQAIALLARSVRLVGAAAGRHRSDGGRVVVRTSMPDHEVVRAAQTGDPTLVAEAELSRRKLLALPPCSAMARVEGDGAGELVASLPSAIESSELGNGYLVRATSSLELADAFADVVAADPAGWAAIDARVDMDPLDV